MNITIAQPLSRRDRFFDAFARTMIPVYQVLRRSKAPWKVTQEELKDYPSGSLGRDIYEFLEKNKLTLIPRAEFHDVYHVLFDFTTSMEDETAIQFLGVGNGRYSLPWLASCALALLFYPERWEKFYRVYQKGRSSHVFHKRNWELYLLEQTADIRHSLVKC